MFILHKKKRIRKHRQNSEWQGCDVVISLDLFPVFYGKKKHWCLAFAPLFFVLRTFAPSLLSYTIQSKDPQV
jgi:hypothetical protein